MRTGKLLFQNRKFMLQYKRKRSFIFWLKGLDYLVIMVENAEVAYSQNKFVQETGICIVGTIPASRNQMIQV